MRYSFICSDSYGGVRPYIALACGLQQAGHEVRLVAPQNFEQDICRKGVGFAPLTGDVEAFLKSPEYRAASRKGFFAVQKLAFQKAAELFNHWMRDSLIGCEGSDVIIAGIGGHPMAEAVAQRLKIPYVQAHLQPLLNTPYLPGPLAPAWMSFSGLGNSIGNLITREVMWLPMRGTVNRARKEVFGLGKAGFWSSLGKERFGQNSLLFGFSRHVFPQLSDREMPGRITGYWFLDEKETWVPPESLLHFLRSGPPPVVLGFGSMKGEKVEHAVAVALQAIRKLGLRTILLGAESEVGKDGGSDLVYALPSAPHDWIYPRAALVIQHGGAGTVGAMLRAGVPGVIVPFAAEQPFWGRQVASLGCGPSPLADRRMNEECFIKAIETCLQASVREKAVRLGQLISAEKGVQSAVDYLTSRRS